MMKKVVVDVPPSINEDGGIFSCYRCVVTDCDHFRYKNLRKPKQEEPTKEERKAKRYGKKKIFLKKTKEGGVGRGGGRKEKARL